MLTMYTNFAKSQAFPSTIKIYSRPRCFQSFHTSKPQSFPTCSYPKPLLNPHRIKTHGDSRFMKRMDFSTCSRYSNLEMRNKAKSISGFRLGSAFQYFRSVKARSFSSSYTQKDGGKNGGPKARKTFPWLASNRTKEGKWSENVTSAKTGRSSWEESAQKLNKVSSRSSWEESAKRFEEATTMKGIRSSSNVSSEIFLGKSGRLREGTKGGRKRMVDEAEDWQSSYGSSEEDKEEEEEEREVEASNDPKWNKIKQRFRGMVDVRDGYEKPELRRWNKQENWGRKTWKEATESTVPKMVGEGVYGFGPVLAALSAQRREFYALYLQEGLDLSNNNRKKKDKKGFEKVLKMAEKIGLSTKEVSKHDLNMVVDNRPHQGLVLDASPLEMVKVNELDPISMEEDKGSLWVALDEVTDPQNLGAIVRSAYFFGASGVVLCAKNSAPLSGVVSKASAGALELMELRYCKNMMQFLVSSAENGWRVLGGSVSPKAVPLDEVLPGAPTILVLGSEGTGLRPLVERSCTHLLRIPGNIPLDLSTGVVDDMETAETNSGCSGEEFRSFMAVESLNVSVAAGVLLHHLIGTNYKNERHVGDKPTDALE